MQLLLAGLLFFKIEFYSYFVNLSSFQVLLLLIVACLCIFIFRKKINCSTILLINKLRYFSFKKYIKKLSKSINNCNPEIIGKSLVNWLERSILMKFGCILMSVIIFSHYPILLTSQKPATIFLLTLTAYFFIGLAFRKEMLLFIVGVYCLILFAPYAMAFIGHNTGINLFESLPIDVLFFVNIDIDNLTQAANKLFLLIVPGSVSIILFLIVSTLIVRNFFELVFTALLKILQLLMPVKLFAAEETEG